VFLIGWRGVHCGAPVQGWFGFYSVIGGLAATLLGLLFVVISINARAVLGEGHEGSKLIAEQAFQNYMAVIMVALLAIFPTFDTATFGQVALGCTALWAVWVIVRLYLAMTRPHESGSRLSTVRRQLSSFIGFGMLVYAAVRMALHGEDSHNLFAIATIVLLFSATLVSWELLRKLARAGR
jgi:hypothetical protein